MNNTFKLGDKPTSHNTVGLLFFAGDLIAILIGAIAVLLLRFPIASIFRKPGLIAILDAHTGFLLLFAGFLILSLYAQGLYAPHRWYSARQEAVAVTISTAGATVLLTAFIYLSGIKTISRFVVVGAAVATLALITGWRYLRRKWMKNAFADGLTCRNVVIAGTGKVAQSLKEFLDSHSEFGFVVLGFMKCGNEVTEVDHDEILGSLKDFASIAQTHFVDEVIVCSHDRETVKRILTMSRNANLGVRIIPDDYDGIALGAPVQYLGHLPTISLHNRRTPALDLLMKRVLDVVVSAISLILLAPLLIVLALLLKLDSRGPVFYVSQRVGKKRRLFNCYKLRTMVTNAEELKSELQHLNERDGVLFKISRDPRITRFGRFLRKYSLDELPQLWNVLRGDMSLVGPRPPVASEVDNYQLEYLRRLDVTPGMTGLWQVEGRRDPSFESYIALDLQYVEKWDLIFDLKLLVRTIGVVFAGTGQ